MLATLRAGAYRRHIENHIRAGNTTLRWLQAWPTMLAAQVAGSETRFLAEMTAEARALGMDHTIGGRVAHDSCVWRDLLPRARRWQLWWPPAAARYWSPVR